MVVTKGLFRCVRCRKWLPLVKRSVNPLVCCLCAGDGS